MRRALSGCGLCAALVASACLMAFAIGSPEFWWLGWTTLLPLFFCIQGLSPRRAMLSGAVWGLSLYLFSVLAVDTPIVPSIGSLALLVTIPALYSLVGARLTSQVGFSPLLLALGWIGVEFALRPLGLLNGLLATTQGDGLVIRLVGSFSGYAVVAFLVAYVNASLLSVLSEVRGSLGGSRFVRRTGELTQRIFPTEILNDFSYLIRPVRPRAPPA